MSKSIRPVKVEWGPASSLFVDSEEDFPWLVKELMGEEVPYEYQWSEPDEVYSFWTTLGHELLDAIRDCTVDAVIKGMELNDRDLFSEDEEENFRHLLGNLKANVDEWREFIDSDGHLRIWVDGY